MQHCNTIINTVNKNFTSIAQAEQEYAGYHFFKSYCSKIPDLVGFDYVDQATCEIRYSDQRQNGSVTVYEALHNGESIDIRSLFNNLAVIANNHAQKKQSEGGSRMFFLDRVERLDEPRLTKDYNKWINNGRDYSINRIHIQKQPQLLSQLQYIARSFDHGVCAPSQGDLHERNIFTDGTVIDFEGAGFNLIATDIATFIWHTLFAGPYFGPIYAKWAMSEEPLDTSGIINVYENNINISLQNNRCELIEQFVDSYVNRLNVLKSEDINKISLAISYRLLTTLYVKDMSEKDQELSFALACYFIQSPNISWLKKIKKLYS